MAQEAGRDGTAAVVLRMIPPYASDTRAKGWRFEIDHERIRQSDTWALAAADVRPWLLMLWMVAWEQAPCGSLPAEGELIAARLGMAPKAFAKHRSVLLRGWQQAEDGRLYHPVLTERVLEMVDYRVKAAARKAAYRDSHASPVVVPRDSTVENDTGTGTGTLKEKKAPAAPSLSLEELQAEGLDAQTAGEFLALRNRKRARLTRLAWDGLKAEFKRAGWTPQQSVMKCIARGWTGFEAAWVMDAKQKAADIARQTTPAAETEEQMRRRVEAQQMTPEQKAAADKAAKIALSAIKNITPRLAA
jgi:hypothetical protein